MSKWWQDCYIWVNYPFKTITATRTVIKENVRVCFCSLCVCEKNDPYNARQEKPLYCTRGSKKWWRIRRAAVKCSHSSQTCGQEGRDRAGALKVKPQMSAVWWSSNMSHRKEKSHSRPTLEVRCYLEDTLSWRSRWAAETKASVHPRPVKVMTRRLCTVTVLLENRAQKWALPSCCAHTGAGY